MASLRWPDQWPEHGPVRSRPWADRDLDAVADLDNVASRRVAEQAGSRRVDRLPNGARIGGKLRNVDRYRRCLQEVGPSCP